MEKSNKKAPSEEPDRADFDQSKRRVDWHVRNFRGGQTRELQLSLTYKAGVLIDEV